MKFILPVAGKGTRLYPHTHSKPKSLIMVAEQTVLQYVIDGIKCLIKNDNDEVIFITDNNGKTIEDFVKLHYPNLKTTYIKQEKQEGPAHAVALASPRIEQGDDVLVVFNDTLFITDLNLIPSLCKNLDGLIFSKEVEDYQRFGVSVVKDGVIVDMVEKPDKPVSNLAQVGLYYLKNGRCFIDYIKKAIDSNLKVKGEFYLPDVFKLMINDGLKLGAPLIDEWLDCGKPETLFESNRFLLNRAKNNNPKIDGTIVIPPVCVDATAKISGSIIGPNVSIGANTKISNSIIKDSIIGSDSSLESVQLDSSLVGDVANLTGHFVKLNLGDSSNLEL